MTILFLYTLLCFSADLAKRNPASETDILQPLIEQYDKIIRIMCRIKNGFEEIPQVHINLSQFLQFLQNLKKAIPNGQSGIIENEKFKEIIDILIENEPVNIYIYI